MGRAVDSLRRLTRLSRATELGWRKPGGRASGERKATDDDDEAGSPSRPTHPALVLDMSASTDTPSTVLKKVAASDMQPCEVCGASTRRCCAACQSAGLDIFFCSKAHQKLVRPFSHSCRAGPEPS